MIVNTLKLSSPDFPEVLRHIATPPTALFTAGGSLKDLLSRPCVTIVGSRKVSTYGAAVTRQLAGDLARAGVVIISGLAYGVDSIAHQAALDAGGLTIAVLPTSLDNIYPTRHKGLALHIIERGGALITEYDRGSTAYKSNFVARNRIAAALSQVTLITEAAAKSGSLHTAYFALEQGKEVMAVPGNITSPTSVGTNRLIKTGASPVTSAQDVLCALGIQPGKAGRDIPQGDTPEQQAIIQLLAHGVNDGTALLAGSQLEVRVFDQNLSMLEITGKVRSLGNNHWSLA